jgi:hypothetical protein
MCGFVAIRAGVRVDFAEVKYVSNRGMLRLEMQANGSGEKCESVAISACRRGLFSMS